MRVLVVDDAAASRRLAVRLVERLGAEAIDACDGETAVALAAAERFDLVLMDVGLPGIDGLEAARRIRASSDHVPRIVALSAEAGVGAACMRAGMEGAILKPPRREQLAVLLAETPRHRGARPDHERS